MKLNPPETAPKDATLIMVCVYGLNLYPAVWNVSEKKWLVAYGTLAGHFSICPVSHKSVTGWLPMPTIDDQGMGDAVMAHDNQAALVVMKDIAVDNGNRAKKAMQEQAT